jgi:hypothetical protein
MIEGLMDQISHVSIYIEFYGKQIIQSHPDKKRLQSGSAPVLMNK